MDLENFTLEELKQIADYMVEKRRGQCDKPWEEIVGELGLNMSKDNFRKASLGALIERIIHEEEEKLDSTDEKIAKLEEKMAEYRKERMKWLDMKASERRDERVNARNEQILELIEGIAKRKNNTYPLMRECCGEIAMAEQEGVLLISDVHFGLECNVVGNIYSPDIAVERFGKLANKVLDYSKKNDVQKLNVFLLGDLINGLIHFTTKLESRYQAIDQTMEIAEILAGFLFLLSEDESLGEIGIYFASGNHERVNPNKKDSLNSEDFGRMILKYLKMRLMGVPQIKFHDNAIDGVVDTYIMDYRVYAVHGDKDRLTNVVSNLSRLIGDVPDFVFMGHYHHIVEEGVGNTEVIANGSFAGNSEYSTNGRLISPPSQRFMIFNKHGRLCTYNINLQDD